MQFRRDRKVRDNSEVMNPDSNTSNMPSTTVPGRNAFRGLELDIEQWFLYSHITLNQCLDFDVSYIRINKTRMERD